MVFKEQVTEVLSDVERTSEVIGSALVSLAALRALETGEHLFRLRWYSQALAEQLSIASPYVA
jgi:response regulator RpfG family c-di-GMP phosphodiesterase